jgi:hypothetical protein
MWESRLSGSERGWGTTQAMGEILWHRRATRRQTEKTNLTLPLGESLVYSNRLVKKPRTEIAVRVDAMVARATAPTESKRREGRCLVGRNG